MIVAFDIETLGLLHETPLPDITCVCMYCGCADAPAVEPEEKERIRIRLWGLPPEERKANETRIITLLDEAEGIVGYNAVLFDLEFLRRVLALDDERAQRWVLKCIDPYLCLRYVVGEGCSMNRMLALNGMSSKTGSGGDAITMALNDEWDKLMDYCWMDAKLAYELCALEWIRIAPGIECKLDWGRSAPEFRLFKMKQTAEGNGKAVPVGEALALMEPIPWPCAIDADGH